MRCACEIIHEIRVWSTWWPYWQCLTVWCATKVSPHHVLLTAALVLPVQVTPLLKRHLCRKHNTKFFQEQLNPIVSIENGLHHRCLSTLTKWKSLSTLTLTLQLVPTLTLIHTLALTLALSRNLLIYRRFLLVMINQYKIMHDQSRISSLCIIWAHCLPSQFHQKDLTVPATSTLRDAIELLVREGYGAEGRPSQEYYNVMVADTDGDPDDDFPTLGTR